MFIHEATAIAHKSNLAMRRKKYPEELQIIPTNDCNCCIMLIEGGPIRPRWNPTAEDLTADDWIVVGDPAQMERPA